MGLHLSEISEGVFYAQYIGWDPAMQLFRDRPNDSMVRVHVIKNDEGALLVSLPHLKSPSPLSPIPLDSALKEWRFVRRIRMSTRMLPVRRSPGSARATAGEPSEPVHSSSQTALNS